MLPQGNSQVFSTPPSGTIHKLEEIQDKNVSNVLSILL